MYCSLFSPQSCSWYSIMLAVYLWPASHILDSPTPSHHCESLVEYTVSDCLSITISSMIKVIWSKVRFSRFLFLSALLDVKSTFGWRWAGASQSLTIWITKKILGMLSELHSCCIGPWPFYPDLTFSEHTLVVWEIQSRSAFSEMPRPACSCCHVSSFSFFFFFCEEKLNRCT